MLHNGVEVAKNDSIFSKLRGKISNRIKALGKKKEPFHIGRVSRVLLRLKPESASNNVKFNGRPVNFKNPDEFITIHREIFKDHSYRFASIKSDPLILDCGAHIGMAILYWKEQFPLSKVVAFEPDPFNFKLLKSNTQSLSNIEFVNKAVWVNDGQVEFEDKGSWGSKISDSHSEETKTIKVDCTRLANYIKDRRVDFLKIDIEGAEYEVLKDCATYLTNVENLFLEYHGAIEENNKLEELLALLRGAGFVYYIKEATQVLNWPFVDKKNQSGFDTQLNIFCYRL